MEVPLPSRLEIVMFWSEFVCILFYGLFVEYGEGVGCDSDASYEGTAANLITRHYPMYMDIHVMVFVGFGFLMTFLKHNSWTAVGFTYLIACWALQICILCSGFWLNVCNQYIARGAFTKI